MSPEENVTKNREQFLDDEVDKITDYVFGVWSWFVYCHFVYCRFIYFRFASL